MTKTIYGTLLIILMFFTNGNAAVGFGTSLGWVYSTQSQENEIFSTNDDMPWKHGFKGGLLLEISHIHPRVAIGLGINYVQNGYIQEFVITGESGPEILKVLKESIQLYYLSIPIYLKVTALQFNTFDIYVMAGARLDNFLKYTYTPETYTAGNINYTGDPYLIYAFEDFLSSQNLGGILGIGIQHRTSNNLILGLQFEYNPDFSNAYHFEQDFFDIFGTNKCYCISFQIMYNAK